MEVAELIRKLGEAGSMGLDLSPGDPLCADAAFEIGRQQAIVTRMRELNSEVIASRDALAAKLRKYGGHTANCAYTLSHYKGPVHDCDCGWTDEVTARNTSSEPK
jgi:hypothetical protein